MEKNAVVYMICNYRFVLTSILTSARFDSRTHVSVPLYSDVFTKVYRSAQLGDLNSKRIIYAVIL